MRLHLRRLYMATGGNEKHEVNNGRPVVLRYPKCTGGLPMPLAQFDSHQHTLLSVAKAMLVVRCGGHMAVSCERCPFNGKHYNHGRSWCSGDCMWHGGQCMWAMGTTTTTQKAGSFRLHATRFVEIGIIAYALLLAC